MQAREVVPERERRNTALSIADELCIERESRVQLKMRRDKRWKEANDESGVSLAWGVRISVEVDYFGIFGTISMVYQYAIFQVFHPLILILFF